ncbi:hypothetical protein [Rhodococcus sp. NPDC058514]|uniref:hypothetical protein n=1 Tax=unclassified Rhodococcus (in: high G+C Gram-positive bacteria) TaxID=192944 RepID=UPI00364658C7
MSACSAQDVEGAVSQLSASAQQALDDSAAARDLLNADSGIATAAAACQLYAGWEGLQADVRSALAPALTTQLERYAADADPAVSSVARLTVALVNGGVDTNQTVVANLREACRAI